MRWAGRLLLSLAAASLLCLSCSSAGATTMSAPASEQDALDGIIHADDGMTVLDPLRNQVIWAMGDATWIDGTDYSKSIGYPHNEFVAQVPGTAQFTVLHGTAPNHYGWQQVPDSACPAGNVFWFGGLLYAPGARQITDYGQCVNPSSGAPQGSYAALFDATTLTFEGLRAMGSPESWSDAVAVRGGWEVIGSRHIAGCLSDCFTGDAGFIPAGDQYRPWLWMITRDVIPASLNAGNVISPFRFADGTWGALTKDGDMYGPDVITELAAPSAVSGWHLTGNSWDIPQPSGVYAYSVVTHGSGSVTFATTSPYQLNFLEVTP